MKGGSKVAIEAHRHEGIFIARGKEDALVSFAWVVQSSSVDVMQQGHSVLSDCCCSVRGQISLGRVGLPYRIVKISTMYNFHRLQVTKNMVVGESVYGEKRISVEVGEGEKVEYRVWNPFRSKLAASVLAGVDNIHIKPGCKASLRTAFSVSAWKQSLHSRSSSLQMAQKVTEQW